MEENEIDNQFKRVEDLIYLNPTTLLEISNRKILDAIDSYLPYSCGMEFECFKKDSYNEEAFKSIPDIMAVEVDVSEQRYRIPSGLKGMICLYNICEQMRINSALDLSSSNHYHFDFTDIINKEYLSENFEIKKYVLQELIKWQTAFQNPNLDNWTRFFNSLGTLEIRIGEPTFDYSIIIKRLIQGCEISKYMKDFYYENENKVKIFELEKQLEELKKQKVPCKENVNVNQVIKTRNFKI